MDYLLNTTETEYIGEYVEAGISETVIISEQSTNWNDSPIIWDAVVENLCQGYTKCIEVGSDSSLFYNIIHHANCLQIEDSLIPTFYSGLCRSFILTNIIDDIVENIHKLDDIAHVRILIAQGFLMELQTVPIVEDDWLLLKYGQKMKWTEINQSPVCNLRVCPSAFKLFFSHDEFRDIHLNFLFRLLGVQKLSLKGCSFIELKTSNLFKNLNLTSLNLRKCGTEVNKVISENIPGVFQQLTHLNISKNPLYEKTLLKLRTLPLTSLNIHNSMKTKSLRESTYFQGILHLNESDKAIDSNVRILLNRTGGIGKCLQELDISNNYLTEVNMEKISQLNLTKLDITGCFAYLGENKFSKISFPSNLKELKALNNNFYFDNLVKICSMNLEKLQLSYFVSDCDDFSSLDPLPIVQSLNELTVYLDQPSNAFISFISKFKLTHFNCNFPVQICPNDILERFITDYPEERECLRSIDIGPNYQLSENFLIHLKNLNLTEISISSDCTYGNFKPILSCVNIQESLVRLKLDGAVIGDCDLIEIRKFKKLEYLSFCYSNHIHENHLKEVVEMKTLKKLKLSALVTELVDLNIARLLCIAPPESLNIYGSNVILGITEEAYEYLSEPENLSIFTSCLTSLRLNVCGISRQVALILKNVNWEKIKLYECSDQYNSLHLIWTSENVSYTLSNAVSKNSRLNWEDILNMRISCLKIDDVSCMPSALWSLNRYIISKHLIYLESSKMSL